MTKAKGFENHPFDFAWWFINGGVDPATRQIIKGQCRISDEPKGGKNFWVVPIMDMDRMAQEHMSGMAVVQGQPIQMADGKILEIPYATIDSDADLWLQRGMRPNPDQNPMTLTLINRGTGARTQMPKVPLDWYEQQILPPHIERRRHQPDVAITFGGNNVLKVPFEFYDAMCKDFARRRPDALAAGWWRELVHQDYGQMAGPKPVADRGNPALVLQGQKPAVMDGVQPKQGDLNAPVAHPMLDNSDVV